MLTMELDLLTQVLRLHDRGLAVFPVDIPTKTPLVEWGGLDARMPTERQVREWFDGTYHNSKTCAPTCTEHAVGIACGPVSEILLLDFDFAKHPEALDFYEKNRHRLPRTWKEKTGSGGLHIYFKWSAELDAKQTNTTSKLHLGVDTKGFGGYSKVTPSPGYEWLIPPHLAPLAHCPQWLIDALQPKDKREITDAFKQKPDDWMVKELDNVDPSNPINGRTPTFVRAIGRLKAKGLNEVEVRSLLAPWAMKYDYPKLDSLVADQFRRYPPRPEMPVASTAEQAENAEAFLADETPVEWICNPFIAKQSIGFIAGLPESRKSWILIDLAIEVARGGGMWLAKFPVMGGRVLLIDQERSKPEAQRRIRALLAAKGLRVADIRNTLFARSGTSTRLDLQPSYDALRKEMNEIRPDLVLVDSFATFHTKNDGNRYEIQPVMERIKELRNEFKCTIVFIHHETKAAYQNKKEGAESSYLDMAGNVAIPAAAEFCMNVVKFDEESSVCHHTKSTQGPKAPPFFTKIRDVMPDRTQISVEAY